MKKWYQKPIAIATAAACLLAGGAIGFSLDSLPQLQLTAEAEDKIYTGESDGLQLEYEELEDGTVEITRFVSFSSTDIELPSVIDGKSVTSIGSDAFEYCTSLTSVTIPESVTRIGDDAFGWCAGLTSITIPDSVTRIGGSAFSGCTGLTSVTIPNSVTSIEDNVFGFCTSLTEIIVDSNNESYISKNGTLFDKNLEIIVCYPGGKIGSFTIPDGVTSIGDGAFSGCTGLTSVTIPDSVTRIGDWAFGYCTSLTSVTIPDSVTSIGGGAFEDCTSLTSITIPDSVTSIGDSAFYECTSLTSVTIPDSVTRIGDFAFDDCRSLTEITVDSNNESYTSKNGILFDKNLEILICCPGGKTGSFTIPDSVTRIGEDAFWDCTGLTSVTIPDSVTSIGDYAFYGCIGLTSVTIPDSVTSIENSTFYNCIGLTSVTIPDSVTSIGDYTFSDCTGLTSVTIPDSVTSIGSSAFANCTNLTDIYYKGTESEWNEISIGDSVIPSNVTIHYESEPVTTTTTTTTTITTTTTTKPITTTTTISEETVAYGDVNTDNIVDLRDTIVLNKYLANIIQFSDVQMANADCYKDGNLDEKDASTLMQFVISLIRDIPVIEE